MNIVQSGSSFQVYKGEDLKTFSALPLGTYEVSFDKQQGFFLTSHEDLEMNEKKIYGNTLEKIDKIITSFNKVNRNFGIILSGRKGCGKSLFARQLSRTIDIPTILVTQYVPGIATFLSNIDQSVMVLFDEFDKVFVDQDGDALPQLELLPLFDGIDNGKKLFVITCNNINFLSDYLKNRPGRFHYHFNLNDLSYADIEEYLKNTLNKKYHKEVIPQVMKLSLVSPITYDLLRAIAFEINQGYSYGETIKDLNIDVEDWIALDVTLTLADNRIFKIVNYGINLTDSNNVIRMRSGTGDRLELDFWTRDLTIKGNELTLDNYELYWSDNNTRVNTKVKSLEIKRSVGKTNFCFPV